MASKGPQEPLANLPDQAKFTTTLPSHTKTRPIPLRINTNPNTGDASQEFGLKTPTNSTSRSTSESSVKSPPSKTTPSPPASERGEMPKATGTPPAKAFLPGEFDYEILRDKPLGSGRWSNVYLGKPSASSSLAVDSPHSNDLLTPPSTPTLPSSHQSSSRSPPQFFALKTAANRACIAALRHEATILTYLSSKAGHKKHVVPFHGYDERHEALVFTALPTNLESVMTNDLARTNEASRTSTLANILPQLSRSLISSLAWLHSTGVVHADIKPANILLRSKQPINPNANILSTPFEPVLADFTSSFGLANTTIQSPASATVYGGGTYEYLAPELLSRPCPPPTPSSDVYAMAITILTLIIGASPFSTAAGNRFQLLEMIKMGRAVEFAMQDDRSEDRILEVAMRVQKSSGIDVLRLLKRGLRKGAGERVSAEDWLKEFD